LRPTRRGLTAIDADAADTDADVTDHRDRQRQGRPGGAETDDDDTMSPRTRNLRTSNPTSSSSSTSLTSFSFLLLFLLPVLSNGLPVLNGVDPEADADDDASARSGFVGCLFTDNLCNPEEVCFDDSVFGRCVSASSQNEDDLYRFEPLNDDESDFLEHELNQLKDEGFSWSDEYAQCIVQTALATVRFNSEFDSGLCRRLIIRDVINTNDVIDESSVDKRSEAEAEAQPPVQKSFKVWTDNPSDPHAVFYKSSEVSDSDPNLYVSRQEDGGILIDPQPDSFSSSVHHDTFLKSYNIFPDVSGNDVVGVDTNDADVNNEMLSEEIVDPTDLFENIRMRGLLEEAEPVAEDVDTDADADVEASRPFDVETRALETPEILLGLDTSDTFNRHKFGQVKRSQSDEQEDEPESKSGLPEKSDDADPRPNSDESQEYFFIPADGDDGSLVFSRNERFDVKKPGPFFPNSANNFFLNKIIEEEGGSSEEEDQDAKNPFAPRDKTSDEVEKGQVEVEQPLLAPVKDKRLLPMVEANFHDANLDNNNNYVHIALNKRLQTWMQGSDLISRLATELDIPEHALTDRLIEDQHVQFRVEPNPQNLDAETMADVVGNNIEIQKRLEDQLGVNIKKIVSGHQDDFQKVLNPEAWDPNLLLGITLAVSTTAVLVMSALALMLIKRRRKLMRLKQNQLEQEEEDSRLRDQYSQLCRDWSSSTKTASTSDATADVKPTSGDEPKNDSKKITSRHSSKELEDSNRPDDQATSNMDISTGHMVLAYMEDHLKNKQRLEQEWVALCGYEAEPCATTVAFKAENKKKNRYPDKLPYDHNRVILNALLNKSSSDYVNASTITDHDPRNPPYIVTQGPLSQTVADFWQMVWEQGSVVIVMLTRLQDNGYHLCHRYWPEEGSEKYHIFEVHLVSEHVWCDDYLVRSVYLKNTRTGETRTVTQFHFRSWPAQGVPTSTKALLEFRRKVNKSYRGRSCPIIVHCSDGVGRAGTYILIDMVLNRMSKGCKEIDIAATLEHIRDQRGGMVQTRQQFEFCLMAVAEEVHAILKALPQ
jgi:receptor-type tyrosine-protein phosphatase N